MSNELTPVLVQWMQVIMKHSMHNLMLFAKEHNTSMAMVNAMYKLHFRGGCGVSDLGEGMGVSNAAASQLLEKMVQQGFVERIEDPNDRRNKRITLTDHGEDFVKKSVEARQSWIIQVSESLSTQEQEQIRTSLQTLIDKTAIFDQMNKRS